MFFFLLPIFFHSQFLQRQREFSADKSVRVGELRNSVKGQRAMHLEAQMKGQHRLNLVPPSLIGHDPLSQKPPEVIEEVTNAVGVNNQPDPDLTGGWVFYKNF